MACPDCTTVFSLLSARAGPAKSEEANADFARSLLAVSHAERPRHLSLQFAVAIAIADGIRAKKFEEAFSLFDRLGRHMGAPTARTSLCMSECQLYAQGYSLRPVEALLDEVNSQFPALDMQNAPKEGVSRIVDGQFFWRLTALSAISSATFDSEWEAYERVRAVVRERVPDWDVKYRALSWGVKDFDKIYLLPGLPKAPDWFCSPSNFVPSVS